MLNNLVFRWPKPIFFMVLGAHGVFFPGSPNKVANLTGMIHGSQEFPILPMGKPFGPNGLPRGRFHSMVMSPRRESCSDSHYPRWKQL